MIYCLPPPSLFSLFPFLSNRVTHIFISACSLAEDSSCDPRLPRKVAAEINSDDTREFRKRDSQMHLAAFAAQQTDDFNAEERRRRNVSARLCKIMIRISVERMSETFGRLLRVIRGRRTRKSKLSRLIGMRVSRYCLLTKFLMRIYDNERPSASEDYPLPRGHSIHLRNRGSQCPKYFRYRLTRASLAPPRRSGCSIASLATEEEDK